MRENRGQESGRVGERIQGAREKKSLNQAGREGESNQGGR